MQTQQDARKNNLSVLGSRIFLPASAGFALAVLGAIVGALSGFGTRWGWWSFMGGFAILKWAAYTGLAAVALSLVGGVATRPGTLRRGFVLSVAGLIIGLVVVGVPLSWVLKANELPRIHDITTDTDAPPSFAAILALRKDAPNSAEYEGRKIAAQQQAAYPDIKPLLLALPQARALKLRAAAPLSAST